MAKLQIITYPDKILSRPAEPVSDINSEVHKIITDMASTMYDAPGLGLAAVQIGCNKRLLVYDVAQKENKRSLEVMINPKIISSEGTTISENEGCLSVPDFRSDVKRAAIVLVEGFNQEGKPLRVEAEGLLAVVLQHEIDHLNGTLFIDRISALKRELYKRRIRKKLKRK